MCQNARKCFPPFGDVAGETVAQSVFQGDVGEHILPAIFKNFENFPVSEQRKCLLSVMRASQACLKAASTHLWRNLYGFEPILHVLPLEVVGGKYALLRQKLSDSCRKRFDLYRRQVRCFNWKGGPNKQFSLQVYTRIPQLIDGDDLFPGLTTLHVVMASNHEQGGVILPLLVSPGLLTVTISGRIVPPTPFLPLLSRVAPNVRKLNLEGYSDPMTPLEDANNITLDTTMPQVAGFRSLQVLVIATSEPDTDSFHECMTTRSESTRQMLESLPLLTRLELTLSGVTDLSPSESSANAWQAACSKLETFKFTYPVRSQAGNPVTLEPFPFLPYVTHIYIFFPADSVLPSSLIMGSFTRLAAASPKLESFHIEAYAMNLHPPGDLADVLPLLSSRSLEELIITEVGLHYDLPVGAAPTHLADCIVEQLDEDGPGTPLTRNTGASNRFREICLAEVIPTPSVDILRILAQRLPRLKKLHLPVQVPEDYSFTIDSDNDAPFQNSLTRLHLGDSEGLGSVNMLFCPDQLSALVEAIDTWFPNLERVTGNWFHRSWEYVDKLREVLQKRRRAKVVCTSCQNEV
ncbi:hypothetical protein BKA70DRAFT_1229363 [Coprinopsis sp. MPI-PUGE-AT-0042]|nr:hypothetical protein BKA70DRAFT_1229363 [Coprinopsis sp. MPI-PUGE-AT-0042]